MNGRQMTTTSSPPTKEEDDLSQRFSNQDNV